MAATVVQFAILMGGILIAKVRIDFSVWRPELPDLYIFVIFGQYGLGLFLRFLVVLSSPRAWAKLAWPGATDPVF